MAEISIVYRNQSIDLLYKSLNLFLYDMDLFLKEFSEFQYINFYPPPPPPPPEIIGNKS